MSWLARRFRELGLVDLSGAAHDFRFTELAEGTILFGEGDLADGLYVVLHGRVKLSRRTSAGRESLLAVLGPGDHLGVVSLFDAGPRTATAVAASDVQLAHVSSEAVSRWIRTNPQLAAYLARVVASRVRQSTVHRSDLVFLDAAARLAKQLLALGDRFGVDIEGRIRVPHDLTQAEIADLVGSSRKTVNRALADFVSNGWVRLGERSIVLIDREGLASCSNRRVRDPRPILASALAL